MTVQKFKISPTLFFANCDTLRIQVETLRWQRNMEQYPRQPSSSTRSISDAVERAGETSTQGRARSGDHAQRRAQKREIKSDSSAGEVHKRAETIARELPKSHTKSDAPEWEFSCAPSSELASVEEQLYTLTHRKEREKREGYAEGHARAQRKDEPKSHVEHSEATEILFPTTLVAQDQFHMHAAASTRMQPQAHSRDETQHIFQAPAYKGAMTPDEEGFIEYDCYDLPRLISSWLEGMFSLPILLEFATILIDLTHSR